jgi:Mg/Co/Ni transporter MgtE
MEINMVRWSSIGLIVLGLIHLLVLGADVPTEAIRWLSLNLWTFDHWAPLRSQEIDLALSNGVFWSTIGSFAVPVILIGTMLLYAERQGWRMPPAIGWALVAWQVVATLLMPPSGFPVGLLVTLTLAIGLQRQARAA